MKFSVPQTFKQTKVDGIFQFSSWLTNGHIEAVGNDWISVNLLSQTYFILLELIPIKSQKKQELPKILFRFLKLVKKKENSSVKSIIKV